MTLSTFRRYRFVSSDPLWVVTSGESNPPSARDYIMSASTFASGAFISMYCMMFMRDSPILRKYGFAIDGVFRLRRGGILRSGQRRNYMIPFGTYGGISFPGYR